MPHPSYLRLLSSSFSRGCQSLTDEDSLLVYLNQKCSLLHDMERVCVLMMDEIYVSPKSSYKGGVLCGFAENSKSEMEEATTVQTFMLSSVLSKHKDVVGFNRSKLWMQRFCMKAQ